MLPSHELMIRRMKFVLIVVFGLYQSMTPVLGQNGLATSIDALLDRDFEPLIGMPEADGLLLRRLSLDLRMLVPTPEELEAYLADAEPDRWARWVQKFLNDPLHQERMVDWLDKTLLQRRPFQHVDRVKWLTYLRKVVDDQKPLDQIAKEIVSSVWWNQSERAKQRFFLERAGDPNAIARDIGRVFFGKDMQCAQCHDHPQIDDYLQIDYHGLLAFVSPSALVEAKYKDDKGTEQKPQIYVERAARDAPFESVFDKGIFYRTGTRAPGGAEAFDPFETPDESYQAKPMPESLDGAPAPPRFSRRNSLLVQLSASNRYFATNWSNRLWAMLIGKGLVHPLDMHHADNPPTNPKLLDALTDGLIASEFRMRPIIEQIVLSQAYRVGARMAIESSLRNGSVVELEHGNWAELENGLMARKQFVEAELKTLALAADAAKQKLAVAVSEWKAVQKERVERWAEVDKSEAAFKEVLKKSEAAQVAYEKAKKQLDDAVARQSLLEDAAKKLEQASLLGLADDTELKQAVTTTKSKAESSKAMIPGLEKGLADATVARDASHAPLDAERTRVKEIAAQLSPVEQRLHTADMNFLAARSTWQKSQSEQVVATNRLADLNRFQDWLKSSNSVRLSEKDFVLAAQTLENAKAKSAAHSMKFVSLSQEIVNLIATQGTVLERLSKAQNEGQESASKRILLRSAIDVLDKSLALVIATEPLVAAKLSIGASIDALDASAKNIDARCSALENELAAYSKRLESESGKLEAEKQESLRVEQHVALGQASVAFKEESVKKTIEACSTAMQAVMDGRQKTGHLAWTRPLSPEQLCLSIFQTTGVLKSYVVAETAELDKQTPVAVDATAEQLASRRVQATRQALDKLRPHLDIFASLYSSGVGQTCDEFFASPDQALYMANGGTVFQWSASSNNNLTGLIAQQADSVIASKMLFRSLLSREPTADEENWINEVLSQSGDKKPAIAQELVWSLLTSSEFRVYP